MKTKEYTPLCTFSSLSNLFHSSVLAYLSAIITLYPNKANGSVRYFI